MSSPTPRLSVVIPTYQAPELLAGALRSLGAQEYDPQDAEIIVVDDGSTGFDPEPLAGLASPLLVVSRHFDHNRGRSAARNAGIELARGAVVIFLDGDMTVEKGFLLAHDLFHRQHPDTAAVGAIRWGEGVPDSALTRYVASRGVAHRDPGPVPFKCFVTGNSSVPRQVLLDLGGGFDPGLSAYGGEDLELGYRLHLRGVGVHYLPGAVSVHHQWRSLRGMCAAMATYGGQSLPRLVERHPGLTGVLRLGHLERSRLHPLRWLLSAALMGIVFYPLRWLALTLDGRGLPDLAFDYLWWAERTRAYREATRP